MPFKTQRQSRVVVQKLNPEAGPPSCSGHSHPSRSRCFLQRCSRRPVAVFLLDRVLKIVLGFCGILFRGRIEALFTTFSFFQGIRFELKDFFIYFVFEKSLSADAC